MQSNHAQLHPTSVSTVVTPAPNVAQPKATTVPVIQAKPVHTTVSTVATPEASAAQPKVTTVPVSHHHLAANEGEPVNKSVSTVATLGYTHAQAHTTTAPLVQQTSPVNPIQHHATSMSTFATPGHHAVTFATLAEHHRKLHPPLTTESSRPHVANKKMHVQSKDIFNHFHNLH